MPLYWQSREWSRGGWLGELKHSALQAKIATGTVLCMLLCKQGQFTKWYAGLAV